VDVEPYFLSCARNIERNPVEAGIVSTSWEYKWSSSRCHALGVPYALLDYKL
jgi:putative transposase